MTTHKIIGLTFFLSLFAVVITPGQTSIALAEDGKNSSASNEASLDWQSLPELPDELGVAGPFVGVHNDALIVAGGANFPKPIWDNDSTKAWHDRIYVLTRTSSGYAWKDGGKLPRPIAYGAAVSTSDGVVCMGGNDSAVTFDKVFMLRWDPSRQQVTRIEYPSLPKPCAYAQATLVGKVIYLAGGQSESGLDSAMTNFWSLDLSKRDNPNAFTWQELTPWPSESRAFNITVGQHNGYDDCVYVMSGRRQQGEEIQFLQDVWEFTPKTSSWRKRTDSPRCVMAGTGIGFGQSHVFILGGADGSRFFMKEAHPGFPKEALAYHTITDTWTSAGPTPQNQVTTVPVLWDDRIIIASGEVRPRKRTASIWSIAPAIRQRDFGAVNYCVLFGYLLAMVGIGVYFTNKNKNTDDYFRGGKHIPWWAAGCTHLRHDAQLPDLYRDPFQGLRPRLGLCCRQYDDPVRGHHRCIHRLAVLPPIGCNKRLRIS